MWGVVTVGQLRQAGRRVFEPTVGSDPSLRRRGGARIQLAVAALAAALVVLVPGAAMAVGGTTLYVDRSNASCSNSGSGTSSQPFCTIGAAAQVVAAGQTVQVAAGTYDEDVTVRTSGTSSAPIVFTAAPGATVTVGGQYTQTNGFTVSTKSWITLNGFNVTRTTDVGIYITGSSHITVSGNHVSYSGHPVAGQTASGIYVKKTTDSLVVGNTVDHNTDSGIQLTGGSTRDEVRANVTFSNAQGYQRAAAGIRLYSSPGNVVDQNITYNNEDSGIESYTGSNNTLLYDNVAYDNGDHGIDNYKSTGQRILANTAYKNVTAGINVEANSTGATLANNISVDNGINSPRTHSNIRIESGSTSGTTLDYDLVHLSTSDTLLIWNSVNYTSLSAFRSASGQELHGIDADPKWASIPNRDFHLTTGSPAIDSANSGAGGQPSVDVEGNGRYDDPTTPNTGVGPRTYDDRGAYEFRQSAPLDHIVISPPTGSITAGASQTYTAQGFDAAGNSLGDVTASTVFSIAPNGSCTGNSCTATVAGAHTVTGNDGGKTATASLAVTAAALDHLVLAPATAAIAAGGSQSYTAEGRDRYDNSLGGITASTTFTIAPDGSCSGSACTATAAGAHTVTGTSSGKTGTASLTVTAAALDHLVLSPATATIGAGGSQPYTAQGRDRYGNSLGDVTGSTTFSVAPDGSCAAAVCSATTAGAHTVTGSSLGATGTASLQVNPGSLDHLALSPASTTLTAGDTQAYSASAFDVYGNPLGDVTGSTAFSIAPDGSCSGNLCTPAAPGTHTVTGDDGGKTGSASLSVVANPVDHIAVIPASAEIPAGGSQSYTAESFDADGHPLGDVTASTTFSITPDGSCTGNVCTATAAGPHVVTGTNAGKTATATLQVDPGALDHLALAPASASIAAGGSQAYTAEGFDQYGNPLADVTNSTTFTIAPDGSCSASSAGSHTVTGTRDGKTGTASLNVAAGPLDHLALAPSSGSIPAGGAQAYSAQGFDQYGNSVGELTASTTFTIDPDGSCTSNSCTATATGAHTVTGTSSGKSATASLQVTTATLDHLVLSPASSNITAGGSQSFTAQGFDAAGNSLGDVTASTTFAIGPDGSCTGGVCTATSAGAHTVTGTSHGATGTAALHVNPASLDHIALSPASATTEVGAAQSYSATAFDAFNNQIGDVTAGTSFTIAPDGSCSGGACTPTTGGLHTVTGTNGGKTATATLSVDFVGNPGFETSVNGWNTSGFGTGITLARVAGSHSGGWAAQITNTNTTNQTCGINDSPNWIRTTTAGTYTGTAWVRADRAGAPLKLRSREYSSGGTLLATTTSQVSLTTSWQLATMTVTVTSPGSTLDFNAYLSSADAPPGSCFYVDDMQEFKN